MNFEKAVEFHGHECPGLAIGYRAAMVAVERFKERSEDEELVAIVENNSCAVDAIQAINGCTFGKGNLIFKDFGKQVYTFFKRGDDKAIRVSLKASSDPADDRHRELMKKISSGNATEEEIKSFKKAHEEKMRRILEVPLEEFFDIKEIKADLPEKAKIYRSLICDECGEGVMETRARLADGKILCILCFDKDSR